jgi:uncharacterized protein involved in cysteine biosynthesis
MDPTPFNPSVHLNNAAKFFRGFISPFKGFTKVVSSGRLLFYALMPIWVCLFAVFYAFVKVWQNPPRLTPYLMDWVPGLFQFTEQLKIGQFSLMSAIFQGLFWVFIIIFLCYFSYILLSIVGAPFYSLLADHILRRKGALPPTHGGVLYWLYTTLKMLGLGLLKLGFFMFLGFLLLMFSFFPLGMILVPFLMALMIAFDCFDFSFECMNMSLPKRFRFFRTHLFAFVGLSLIIVIVGTIPGMFVLTLPFFIAGSADLFADLHAKSQANLDVKSLDF